MAKNEIADKVFEATVKLELMQTLIGVMINMVEEREVSTPEDAMFFCKPERYFTRLAPYHP